ncbi:hypothetical protein [Streptomyces lancefieldiae]|uniref:Membrane-bound hydrophilic protein n=1 Tax=Streptomyces lancefieldiae TaxID=3075520 RepID=A0ABU3AU80_9ACTN|nr:hypothetical protein [Streptomyces sp. DSM 40712]MDT0613736.1 hypothetical protein [Streptomyces sp. DSM 40712]
MPGGKAIALAAMPTAVLMGMGFTPTLALADGNDGAPPANSLTAEEYKACVAALEEAEEKSSESPGPSASEAPGEGEDGAQEPDPSASSDGSGTAGGDADDTDQDGGSSSSPDSGSDDEADPAPSASKEAQSRETASGAGGESAAPSPSESKGGGLLDGLGDALEGILTGGGKTGESPAPTPSASASESASGPLKDTTGKVTDTVEDTVEDTTGAAEDTEETVEKAAEATRKAVEEAKEEKEAGDEATASPDPSESASADPEDCPIATDAVGGVDNAILLPDRPWQLNASSLTLKGASYKGIVEVRTANGTTKKVLKYVISHGTDIGDLHQTVKDEPSGKTYHVQAAKGSTSTITDGDTVMYTESISGNLLGLIPITFDPEHPPPLDIPLIYFTKVTVVQAGQFGGTLHIPGLHQYVTG